jgi:hypothetical protein
MLQSDLRNILQTNFPPILNDRFCIDCSRGEWLD